ncbi:hypothetical protein [Methanolobus halotolerans]|uniref:Uncharacterized protein n=1 Tax=Methanolobus halotolerans TaxID=2052935 RepID=A0A4E0PXF2_9EURY|nr:hypothetical protein [Methanolobus halotolerans]TGC10898.1 hypothetical protein CUN85_01705 [Methanolobus halotolerans]
MNSIGIFNFLDLAIRLSIVIVALLLSNLLIRIDADVIRSRIYVSFRTIKKYFVLLTVGFLLYLADAYISISEPVAVSGGEHDILIGMTLTTFQVLILVFLVNLYVVIRVPDRRIL